MREVTYTDSRGRMFKVEIPNDEPDDMAQFGILIGPPDCLDLLDYPEQFTTRLHNELFHRRLYTLEDINHRRVDAQAAIQSALRVDTENIIRAYGAQ